MLQEVLGRKRLGLYQRKGWRQTEYQSPKFSSRQCGSEQSFLRVSASAVGSEGGGVADESEHAAKTTIMTAIIPGLTARLLSPRRWDSRRQQPGLQAGQNTIIPSGPRKAEPIS